MLLSLRLHASIALISFAFLFKTNHFDVRLDSIIATFTGGIADQSS